jgi:hypothetical protein
MDLALAALLRWAQSVEDHEAERQARTALVRVYWAAIHIAFDSHVADIAGLVELDQRASAAVIEAEEINRYIGDLRLREQRPGFKKPEGEARPRKRQLESDLREIEQRAKELRKSSGSASTVARMARLLAEYYLRLPDLKPRLVALPNDL